MFDEAIRRAMEQGKKVRIFTPFGYSDGVILRFDGECFEFEQAGMKKVLILYAEDLLMLEE